MTTKQSKPPVNHDDWTPVPEEWLSNEFHVEIELANMLSNEFLQIAYKMMWRGAIEKDLSFDQIISSIRYAQICKAIAEHRGIKLISPLKT